MKNDKKILDECVVRLCRSEEYSDGELMFEVLLNNQKPTVFPYSPQITIFPDMFTDDKKVFLINVSACHFGYHYTDRRDCAVYIKKVFGYPHKFTMGTFLEGEAIAQAIFEPHNYKIGEEVIVARVREHNLIIRNVNDKK